MNRQRHSFVTAVFPQNFRHVFPYPSSSPRGLARIQLLAGALAAAASLCPGAPPPAAADEPPHYEGVGSCSSSQCHGALAPRKGTAVLQNEYTTWKKHDPHSKAWQVLLGTDSKRMAHHLGIEAPESAPLCLQCHTTHTSNDRVGQAFHFEDGVGCESCHGAAEKWLSPHQASDATHENNVKLGLIDLKDPKAQAKLCTSCHFGTDDKYVNHRLIGAGHPRLSFELDTFQSIEPRHWEVDEDYRSRKAGYDPVEAWFTGQFAQAVESMNRLQSAKRSKHGIFPEFALFECATCHHSLTDEQWKRRDYDGQPGVPRLNLASLTIIREALAAVDKPAAQQLAPSIESLRQSYLVGGGAPANAISAVRSALTKRVRTWTSDSARTLLRHFVRYATNESHLSYEVGEQIAMALSVFASVLERDSGTYKQALDDLYATLKNPKNFIQEDFSAAAQRFQKQLR